MTIGDVIQIYRRARIRLFGEPTPRYLKRTMHDWHALMTNDERDRYEVEYKVLKEDRDEWKRRAEERDDRYQRIRKVLDYYASRTNWDEDNPRLWITQEPGWTCARNWIYEVIEKERV